jgi:L-fuculose-phosphate aldolase
MKKEPQEAIQELMEKLGDDHPTAELPLTQRLALACRVLADNGHGSALSGQMTARGRTQGTMWTLAYGLGFEEAQTSNYLLVDSNLEVLEGKGQPNPANRFHLHVYNTRPDVNAIVHTHPKYCSALALLGEPLHVAHMDTAGLYDDVAHLEHWPGIPFGDEEGEIISSALGQKSAILLAHHGQLCVGPNVEAACVLGVTMERAAQMHLLARAAGELKAIDPKLGREAHDWRHNPKMISMTFDYYVRRTISKDGSSIVPTR